MIKVKCIVNFKDRDMNLYRQIGDEFIVTEDRAKQLMDSTKPGGCLVVEVKEKNKEASTTQKRKATKKK